MSRLARKPIVANEGVTVSRADGALLIKGPKGEIRVPVLPHIEVAGDGSLVVSTKEESTQARANQGTMWSLIQNAFEGVTKGFAKILEIEGVGYRATLEADTLVLALGYVNPVRFPIPKGITIVVEKNVLVISGIDKELVGRIASQIRALKKPEPYKGKGIHYRGEVIRRKVGKKAATAAA